MPPQGAPGNPSEGVAACLPCSGKERPACGPKKKTASPFRPAVLRRRSVKTLLGETGSLHAHVAHTTHTPHATGHATASGGLVFCQFADHGIGGKHQACH